MSILTVTQSLPRFSVAKAINYIGYTFAILFSVVLIRFAYYTLHTCFGIYGACGNPCTSAYVELSVSPVIFTLLFIRLFWLKGLSFYALIARCAVNCGLSVRTMTFVVLNCKGWFF